MTTLVTNIGELVTMAGGCRRGRDAMRAIGIIRDAAFTVRDGRFDRVGSRAEIPAAAEVEIDAGGRLVTPGFVDAHTHPVFAGTRANEFALRAEGLTYKEIAARGGGIRSTVARTRTATEAELVEAGRRYARWFLRCGTTTLEAKSGYGLTLDDELKLLRAIRALNATTPLRYVPTLLAAHIVPDGIAREDYLRLVTEEMIPAVARERLAEYCDVFVETGAFTEQEARQIACAAWNHGLKTRLHVDQLTAGAGAQLAAELGAATADHLEHTTSEGIAALLAAGVQPVLLPGSVYALGSDRYPDARAMIDEGLPVVLATDFNPGTSPTPSMPMVLSLAVTHMRMTPAEAFAAATINAAHSLDRGEEIGSIEPGKIADFVVHDCADYRDLAYFFGVEQTHSTWTAGRRAIP